MIIDTENLEYAVYVLDPKDKSLVKVDWRDYKFWDKNRVIENIEKKNDAPNLTGFDSLDDMLEFIEFTSSTGVSNPEYKRDEDSIFYNTIE